MFLPGVDGSLRVCWEDGGNTERLCDGRRMAPSRRKADTLPCDRAMISCNNSRHSGSHSATIHTQTETDGKFGFRSFTHTNAKNGQKGAQTVWMRQINTKILAVAPPIGQMCYILQDHRADICMFRQNFDPENLIWPMIQDTWNMKCFINGHMLALLDADPHQNKIISSLAHSHLLND